MTSWPILSVVTFLPLVGALFIATLNEDADGARNTRWAARWTTLITFAISLILIWRFDPSTADFQFVEKRPWLGGAINYSMGVDGISLPFVILTTGLMPICILASWTAIQSRVREYMIAFLVLETLMVGTFCALDLVLFYLSSKAPLFQCSSSSASGAVRGASMQASSSSSTRCSVPC